MDLNPTAAEQHFRDELRAWLHTNIPEGWDPSGFHDEDSRQRFEFLRAWQKKMFEAGWVGIHWPKEYGGRGASLIEQTIFIEEIARAAAPPLINILCVSLFGPTLIAFRTQAPKQTLPAKNLRAD